MSTFANRLPAKKSYEIPCVAFSVSYFLLASITHYGAADIILANSHPSFGNLPLCVSYEVTRVFLHAGVSLDSVQFSIAHAPREYDALWKFLKHLPPLQGKPFPERSGREAWEAALGDFQRGPRAVYMAGKLRYNSSSDPLFRFQLEPLRLDYSHRLGRRFGHDRFFEIDIPNLTGRQLPKALEQVEHLMSQVVIQWLVDEHHHFLERTWSPFFIKPKDRKDRKAASASGKSSTEDPEPVHRMYFFATDGSGFRDYGIQLESSQPHAKISTEVLLDCIRPTSENAAESYLKLFARTALGKN